MSSGENWKAQEYFFCGDDFVIIFFFPGFLEIASCGIISDVFFRMLSVPVLQLLP